MSKSFKKFIDEDIDWGKIITSNISTQSFETILKDDSSDSELELVWNYSFSADQWNKLEDKIFTPEKKEQL